MRYGRYVRLIRSNLVLAAVMAGGWGGGFHILEVGRHQGHELLFVLERIGVQFILLHHVHRPPIVVGIHLLHGSSGPLHSRLPLYAPGVRCWSSSLLLFFFNAPPRPHSSQCALQTNKKILVPHSSAGSIFDWPGLVRACSNARKTSFYGPQNF